MEEICSLLQIVFGGEGIVLVHCSEHNKIHVSGKAHQDLNPLQISYKRMPRAIHSRDDLSKSMLAWSRIKSAGDV